MSQSTTSKPTHLRTVPEKQFLDLKGQFDELIHVARDNENLYRRFCDFEASLMASKDLPSLLNRMTTGFMEYFDIPYLSLVIERNVFDYWHLNPVNPDDYQQLLLFDLQETPNLLLHTAGTIYLGATPKKISGKLMIPINTLSFAQLPLARNGQLIGVLNMGSPDPQRFSPDMGTEFLERLTMITSLCFENACNMEQVRQLSLVDGLTNVCNRRAFDEFLMQETSSHIRYKRSLSCLFLDIDFFKKINDRYGHQVGDEALKQLSAQVKPLLRRSDHLARYGGEEFAILLPETDLQHACAIAERIRQTIARMDFELLKQSLSITLSIGVSSLDGNVGYPMSDTEALAKQLVKDADDQVYRAKKNGRNQISSKLHHV